MTARWCIATLALTIALSDGFAQAPGSISLPELMASLSKVQRSSVAFEETRHFAMLTRPLVRRGTLLYERPDRLRMEVVTPFPETTEIAGTTVRVEGPDQKREWSLAGQPAALAWIDAIRASLAGDQPTLERTFRTSASGTLAAWQLDLEPLDPRVASALKHVRVMGHQAQPSSIEILDGQGDRIVIALRPVERTRP